MQTGRVVHTYDRLKQTKPNTSYQIHGTADPLLIRVDNTSDQALGNLDQRTARALAPLMVDYCSLLSSTVRSTR